MRVKQSFLKVAASGALIVGLVIAAPSPTEAVIIDLHDRNSDVQIDTDGSISGVLGMEKWVVDGTDHLFQQWFWYRIGGAGGESAINSISAPAVTGFDTNFNPGNDLAAVKFENGRLRVVITYSLAGGLPGTNSSDLGEQITIDNLSTSPLDLHFFQYTDFDVGGSSCCDTVTRQNPSAITQKDSLTSVYASETVSFPSPSHFELEPWNNTLASLTDGSPTTLNDANLSVGPSDVTWAFQWDVVIPIGGSFQASKNKHILVPEPASLLLFGVGLIGMAGFARRRRAQTA